MVDRSLVNKRGEGKVFCLTDKDELSKPKIKRASDWMPFLFEKDLSDEA